MTPRSAAPLVPLARVWLFDLVYGACVAAAGWRDAVGFMVIIAGIGMADAIDEKVRHGGWALAAGVAAGTCILMLARAAGLGPADSPWAAYPVFAAASLAALAVFAAVTRLPGRARAT
ncbi:hypothetical protein ACIPJS_08135 [Streptomyces sp. NPDC086783]|uniref:hypothetical protein n=1 Tax=Streptomyces sp. NPDC086783 TaxID=3365758 RepID=UPI0038049910